MGKNKQPQQKHKISNKKEARTAKQNKFELQNMLDHSPVWQLKILDMEHKQWGWKQITAHSFNEIHQTLKNYETMTWSEIFADKKRNHSEKITDISSKAIKRLRELKLEDREDLFRLRINGKQRIWGILDRYVFQILWWDPEHTVYPSTKSHT